MIRLTLLILSLFLAYSSAIAQTNVRRFTASPYAGPNLSVDSAINLGKDRFDFRVMGDYEHQSLIFINQGDPEDILGERLLLDTTLVFGALRWLDVALAVPLALSQAGQTLGNEQTLANVALGDPRLSIRSHLASNQTKSIEIAGILETWAPIGDEEAFMAEGGPGFTARVASDFRIASRTGISAGLGYHLRPEISLAGLAVDDEIQGALAAHHTLGSGRFAVTGELKVATDAFAPFEIKQRNAGDLNLGGRWNATGGHQVTVGTGFGILSGIGSPKWRAFVGYGYAGKRMTSAPSMVEDAPIQDSIASQSPTTKTLSPKPKVSRSVKPIPVSKSAHALRGDIDQDGLAQNQDQCPYLAEDLDGFRDTDGCPESDNDLDGIPDASDGAPNSPEDWDGYKDTDGIADTDNDRDGFEDSADSCPNRAGAGDGCPGTPLRWMALIKRRASTNDRPVRLGQLIFPGRVIAFHEKSHRPREESESTVDALAEYIRLDPSLVRIEVGVHRKTNRGVKQDRWLSTVHAMSIKNALVKKGVDADRLFPYGYGRTRRDNNVKTAHHSDSHVELRVLAPGERARKISNVKLPPQLTPRESKPTAGAIRPLVVKKAKRLVPDYPIRFRARKSALTERGQQNALQLIALIKQYPNHHIEVGVHTDGLGAKKMKLGLSQSRADSLRDYLIAGGIDQSVLTARGYGATKPIADDSTIDGRAKNRRVELLVREMTPPTDQENNQ